MPAKSAAQKRLMDAAAHNPAFAKKVGIPSKVAQEFSSASKGTKFGKGGEMKESKAMAKKEISFMQKKGAPKSMIKHEKEEYGMKKGGKIKKYEEGGDIRSTTETTRRISMPVTPASGGRPAIPPGIARAAAMSGRGLSGVANGRFAPPVTPPAVPAAKKGGAVKKMAAGGYTRAADGIAQKGKTKGKQVAMKKGGMCK